MAPTRSYNFRAYDPGTNNVLNSTGLIDAACAKVMPCAGIYGTSFMAGQIAYFAVEASSGGGAAIEFEAN